MPFDPDHAAVRQPDGGGHPAAQGAGPAGGHARRQVCISIVASVCVPTPTCLLALLPKEPSQPVAMQGDRCALALLHLSMCRCIVQTPSSPSLPRPSWPPGRSWRTCFQADRQPTCANACSCAHRSVVYLRLPPRHPKALLAVGRPLPALHYEFCNMVLRLATSKPKCTHSPPPGRLRLSVTHVLSAAPSDGSWTGERGFITREMIKHNLSGPGACEWVGGGGGRNTYSRRLWVWV